MKINLLMVQIKYLIKEINMKKLSDVPFTEEAQFLEKVFRKKLEETGIKFKPNSWVIEEIQKLLNCYPILRGINYKNMSLKQIKAIIQRLSEQLDMQYTESDKLIIVDLTETAIFFSLQEMIVWVVLALLKDKSHIHLKFNKALFDDMKVSEADAIDYICDNSYLIQLSGKSEYHFSLSVAAILSFDYNNQDPIISSLTAIQKRCKKDLSLSAYFDFRKMGENIDTKPILKKQSGSIKLNL